MKRILIALVLCGLPMCALAQEKEEAKLVRPEPKRVNPLKTKKFWIETAITFGFAAWDAETTVRGLERCSTCTERFPLLSKRPSRTELYAKGGAIIAGERAIIAALWHYYPLQGSAVSTGATGMHVIWHTVAARHNMTRIRSDKSVCPSGSHPSGTACLLD